MITAPDGDAVGSAAWWDDRGARLRRRRPRPDGLTIESIIATALSIVDTDGLDVLTVRRLADTLGTGSASLYRHVASREELLVLLVDEVLGEIVLPATGLGGRAKVEWLSIEFRRVLLAHPHLLPALAASPLLGPNAMRGAEAGLANLIEAGFDMPVAMPAYLAMIDYVLGTVYFDTSRAGRTLRDDLSIERPTAEEVFRFGLTTFLDGLERGHR
ncbi:MAG: hypothetical protein JWM34_2373 [Ilumatobacteraceae bacterium]|nr:hypothetical protein [Ilumatobacteraceae bacterium]